MSRTVTVNFTEAERAAFLARTDRREFETIYSPYEAFIYDVCGEWDSMWVENPDEDNDPFINADDEEEYHMPVAASGYCFDLLSDADVTAFNEVAPFIRKEYDELQAMKAAFPHHVLLDAGEGHHPDSFFVEHMIEQLEWCRDNCPHRYNATENLATLYPGHYPVLFVFLDKEKAALFRLMFG